ncbi:MAG: FAD-dependent oxidoreductase [Hyphomicrobiales bacterium]|nr:FAD-dependent oxidoreductase [Hyphomicrobiales bacterium]
MSDSADRARGRNVPPAVSRRGFLAKGAAGVGAVALTSTVATEATAQTRWDRSADVVVIGAGVSGLPAAIMARDHGASVIVIDANYDIGGRGILSGGRIHLGGGHALQQKLGVKDTPDKVFEDWIRFDDADSRYSDRDLVRVFANENVPTYDFLIENGVKMIEKLVGPEQSSTVARTFLSVEWENPAEVIAPKRQRNGSGIVRALAASARKKGAEILLEHRMTEIIREKPTSGRVLGVAAANKGRTFNIQAKKGVIVATGGHTGNVDFRRMFDPRLTEEYQQACQPWVVQDASGELAAMDLGAALWSTANQTTETAAAITKTRHIGCQWGYSSLVYEPESPIFKSARATGLTVKDWQNVVLVNDRGNRFWNEVDGSYDFFAAAMAWNGDPEKLNGGGPIWAIFDADAAAREKWLPKPPHVDLDGWFFVADTLAELAGKIENPYQRRPISGRALEETIARYNSFVTAGKDADFDKPKPMYKIQTPPFYAAWSTPILHDALTGLRTNRNAEVVDTRGRVIDGLYCVGEAQGGFSQHGLARCLVFGRVAGRHAAQRPAA